MPQRFELRIRVVSISAKLLQELLDWDNIPAIGLGDGAEQFGLGLGSQGKGPRIIGSKFGARNLFSKGFWRRLDPASGDGFGVRPHRSDDISS